MRPCTRSRKAPPALTAGLAPVRIPAAHKNVCVPLLPSGPDGVYRFSLRGSWHSTPLPAADRSETTLPQPGIRPRYSGLRVQGTATSPPSTISKRPRIYPAGPLGDPATFLVNTSAPGENGGDDRIRTDDPLVANEVLSQLSYIPTLYHQRRPASRGRLSRRMAEREGFEPSEELPPQRFSRPSRSTAPASLRRVLYIIGAKISIAESRITCCLCGLMAGTDMKMAEREGFEPSEESPPHTISNRAD